MLFFGDKDYFLEKGKKAFSRERLAAFLEETGVALFDTAMEVIRQRGNASDQFLEIVTPVDLDAVLKRIPKCKAIVTTGQKATDTLLAWLGLRILKWEVLVILNIKGGLYGCTGCLRLHGLTRSL